MVKRRTVEDWRREVFASKTLSAATKVLCLYLADHMHATTRKVSVPRPQIAQDLGVHHARVAERLDAAIKAGYLDRVVRGRTGTTAVYQGLFPDVLAPASIQESGTHVHTAPPDARTSVDRYPQPDDLPPADAFVDTALLDATTRADPSLPGQASNGGDHRSPRATPAERQTASSAKDRQPLVVAVDAWPSDNHRFEISNEEESA